MRQNFNQTENMLSNNIKYAIAFLAGCLFFVNLSAQPPDGISHQAVMRDAEGEIVENAMVGIRVSILHGSENGSPVYVETHSPETDQNGLMSYIIGQGDAVEGSFDQINWSEGPLFLKTEADPQGGSNYQLSGITEILSVPFALHAATSQDTFTGYMSGMPVYHLGNPQEDKDAVNLHYVNLLIQRIENLEDTLGITPPDEPVNTIEDIDGNVYPVVTIGDQEWMAANLRVSRYNNGDSIPLDIDHTISEGAYDIYDHQEVSGINSDEEMLAAYGKMYNWYAVADERGLCPEGWTVPSHLDWTELSNYLIDKYEDINEENAGSALKDCRQVNSPLGGQCNTSQHPRWDEHHTEYGTDDFGFSALPGGYRHKVDNYSRMGISARLWSSTPTGDDFRAWNRGLNRIHGQISEYKTNYYFALSVRCVKIDEDPDLATVTTSDIEVITSFSAIGGGEVTHTGGTGVSIHDRGLVWSTSENPTIDDNDGMTIKEGKLGEFSSTIEDLSPETTYFVRAYATTVAGVAYGEQISFTTDEDPDFPGGTVTDIEGNEYQTLFIGEQEWMAENLRVTKYNNQDEIITGLDDEQWVNATEGAYAVFPYDHEDAEGIDSEEEMVEIYGKLYNWYAVTDDRELCPEGWRVPSRSDVTQLLNYLENSYDFVNEDNIGNTLKDCRQINSPLGGYCNTSEHPRWDAHSTQFGTNDFGYSAIPAGYRFIGGNFTRIGRSARWWTATEMSEVFSWNWTLSFVLGEANIYQSNLFAGFSVRCVRDIDNDNSDQKE